MGYDAWRDIRHRPARALWRAQALPFEVQLFHVGGGHPNPVRLFEIVGGVERGLRVPLDAFDYGNALRGAVPAAPEVAGFRVHHPIRKSPGQNELIVFLGASYFRVPVDGRHFGASARGVAVDTAGGQGEEFPIFEAFWLVRPARGAASLTVYALLNGPRVAGAYRFIVRPGAGETTVDVQARLFLRAPVAALGIAPLTSMFLSGENQPRPGGFRPEVHDSDGLSMWADGEWSWQPLINPPALYTRRLAVARLSGFGLMQRDRSFASYEDTEARYERRPSVWVEPLGDWGAGRVELMQFNVAFEFVDNAVAYWVSAKTPAIGEPFDIAWRLHWQGEAPQRPPLAWVVQTRRGHGTTPHPPDEHHFVIDFEAAQDASMPVTAIVDADGPADILETQVYRHPVLRGWRMTVKLRRTDKARAVELRAVLRHGDRVLSETWRYALPPE